MVSQLCYVNIYSLELFSLTSTLALTTTVSTGGRFMVRRPGAEAVVGVEVHGVVLLLPGHLLKCHSRLVGGEYGRMEGQPPVYAQPDKTNKSQG